MTLEGDSRGGIIGGKRQKLDAEGKANSRNLINDEEVEKKEGEVEEWLPP